MNAAMDAELERFHPLLLHSILAATRRFEPDFYSHLCRVYHLDADRIMGLFVDVDEKGPGQLIAMLRELREHPSYHDITFLAGRNSFHSYSEQRRLRMRLLGSKSSKFDTLLKQLLPAFLGRAPYNLMLKGELQFVEVRDSVFARQVVHPDPVCSFYAGLLAELGTACTDGAATATEVRCVANDPEALSCLFRVSL